MRRFTDYETNEKRLSDIFCNRCGKKIQVINGVPEEDVLSVEKRWGYFSSKDNEVHRFDLCEDCYDELLSSFRIPAEKAE